MKRFDINGNEYKSKEFDFNTVCELEDMGISLNEAGRKSFSLLRAYFAMCSGKSMEEAGKELEQHMIHGGKFTGISEALNEEMEKSDFFRALKETAQKEDAENPETEAETQ